MHNSLAPQAAGSETVVGLSVVPKLFQGIWATWEQPEGFGAWGHVHCLCRELAPQKKKKRCKEGVPDGLEGRSRKPNQSVSALFGVSSALPTFRILVS